LISDNNQSDLQSEEDLNDNDDEEEIEYFQSKVDFYDEEIEFMITDLKDLLSRLQEKNVIDFKKENAIMLLDRKGTKIEFKKTEISELKRFLSLINESFPLFNYLVRNPSSFTITKEVQRNDRIMGSVNLQKTFAIHLKYPTQRNTVICNEIHKTSNTPENYILAQILFSINIICNGYISKKGVLNSGVVIDEPTIKNLEYIQNYTIDLLSTKVIKEILPYAISNISNYESYLEIIVQKIFNGILPRYYIGLTNILRKWKYFVWISNNNPELIEHSLRYYFFNLKDKKKMNRLYECWVFYKILDCTSDTFKIKFKEITKYKEITFEASSSSKIKNIVYQKKYETGWTDKNEQAIPDRPDIVINFRNKKVIIIDAKNSNLDNSSGYPYRDQMDSYIQSAGIDKTDYAIFLFSKGNKNPWKEIKRKNQKMIWMSLTPSLIQSNGLNNITINELINMIENI
jgi:hypothetical protein